MHNEIKPIIRNFIPTHEQMTATELTQHFEVSKRTILRDIDTLTEAGMPIYNTQGKGGGINILDNFVPNKMLVPEVEKS